MEPVASVVGVAVVFALIFALGEWLFGRLTSKLASRLHGGWRWFALPFTAVLSFGAFLVLRPLVLDQPRTPLWFVGGAIAVALLVTTGTATGWAMGPAGRVAHRVAARSV